MIQHQMLQEGQTLEVRDMPHTEPTGLIDIVKVEFSVVHFHYRRKGEDTVLHRSFGKAHCETMIVNGYWTEQVTADARA